MILILIMATILVIADQLSKYFVLVNMNLGESKTVIDNFFSFTSHRNRGAAWGILEDSRLFFIIVTIVFLIVLLTYIYKSRNKLTILDIVTFSLVLGGGIGNFIDRIRTGEVVDFLDFNIFGYAFPIFNLADTFICIGVFFLIIKIYREE